MAKRKKASKVQKRGKLPRGKSATRSKARKAAQAKTAARAKPKPALVKKAVRKVKRPVAPVVETVAVEHPAPEFEEASQVSPGPDEPEG
jgi:hypothetical protein